MDRRGPRKTIAAIGIAVWSLALELRPRHHFWQLSWAGWPSAPARLVRGGRRLLADFFPPSAEAGDGLVLRGTLVGGGCAPYPGGALWRSPAITWWRCRWSGRSTLQVVLIWSQPGFIVAPLTLVIPEPRRLDGGAGVRWAACPWPRSGRTTRPIRETLVAITSVLSAEFCAACRRRLVAACWCAPRLEYRPAGATVGLMTLVLGPIGAATAGALADALAIRGRRTAARGLHRRGGDVRRSRQIIASIRCWPAHRSLARHFFGAVQPASAPARCRRSCQRHAGPATPLCGGDQLVGGGLRRRRSRCSRISCSTTKPSCICRSACRCGGLHPCGPDPDRTLARSGPLSGNG